MKQINFYERPDDVRAMQKLYPSTKAIFSIRLIESRMHLMNEETKSRAKRTIHCLKTGDFWDESNYRSR